MLTADKWTRLGLLSNDLVREIGCVLCETPGRGMTLVDLVRRESLKKLASSTRIRNTANDMREAELLDRTGDRKSGYSYKLKTLQIPQLTWHEVYEMHRGKKLHSIE